MTGRSCPTWCTITTEGHGIHRATVISGRGVEVGLLQGPSAVTAIGVSAPGGSVTLTSEQAWLLLGGLKRALYRTGYLERPARPTATERAAREAGADQ